MKRHRGWVLALAAALLVVTVPVGATDDDPKRQQWVQRYQDVRTKHAKLEQDLAQARIDYSRGRSSRHLRGEGKAGLLVEIARLEQELEKADQQLRDFPDEARRDGALPGWFRDLEAPTPAAAQPTARKQDEPARSTSRSQQREKKRASRRIGRD